ncbi:MAG: hypothetical protein ACJAUN_001430 [Alcanivorax sp.]|jgi:hypothetical protein
MKAVSSCEKRVTKGKTLEEAGDKLFKTRYSSLATILIASQATLLRQYQPCANAR